MTGAASQNCALRRTLSWLRAHPVRSASALSALSAIFAVFSYRLGLAASAHYSATLLRNAIASDMASTLLVLAAASVLAAGASDALAKVRVTARQVKDPTPQERKG